MKARGILILFLSIALIVTGIFVYKSIPDDLNTNSKETIEKSTNDAIGFIYRANPISTAINSQISVASQSSAKEKQKQEIEQYEKEIKERERLERLAKEALEADKKSKNSKVAYLTFDDGPSKIVTPALLDILDKYEIKATFFNVGKMVKTYPDITKDAFDRGHAIGNHSYSHEYSYIYKSTKNFLSDINKAEEAFKAALGEDFSTKLFRFPGGSFEKKKNPMKKAITEAGYVYYDWNTVNGDAEKSNPTTSYLFNRFSETYKGKNSIIVLMHDTDAKKANLEAVPLIIERLIKEGYRFDTLNNYPH